MLLEPLRRPMCHSSRSRPGPAQPRTCPLRHHPCRRIRRRQLFPPCWPWTRTTHCRRRCCPAAAGPSVPPRPSRRFRQPKRIRRRHPVAGPAAEAGGAGPARFRCFHLLCLRRCRRIRRRCFRSSSSCRLFAQNGKTERNFIYELRSDVIMSCKANPQPAIAQRSRSRNHERRHHILRGLPLCSAFVESPQLSRWLEREREGVPAGRRLVRFDSLAVSFSSTYR